MPKKSSEMIINAIKEAYIDGYKADYKDRDNQLPENFEEDGIEYVDLGLPSGTLWPSDSLRENGEIVYLPYDKAVKYNIPTEEQWKELEENCRFKINGTNRNLFRVLGPSGNYIEFNRDDWYIADDCKVGFRFWLNGKVEGNKASCIWGRAYIPISVRYKDNCRIEENDYASSKFEKDIDTIFKGYKLPVKLVK